MNILNDGAIPDFPDGAAVEVPAVIDRRGITGLRFESSPKGFGALIRNYAGVYDVDTMIDQQRRWPGYI